MQALEPGDPRSIGGIRILARVGAGGMAIVYFGRSAGGRALAVKVMHAEFAREPEFRERFRREVDAARLAGGGYSPAVVEADPEAAVPWLATEFMPSVSLRDAVRTYGPLPAEALWALAAGIAEALFAIHRAGVAHLDLKPANVLLTVDGPRLIDFGIARLGTGEPEAAAGSRGFTAPEQLAGADAGPASDVYSFGATLAFAGTGSTDAGIGDDVLQSMIQRCQDLDPGARPTIPELIGYLISARPGPGARQPDNSWLPAAVLAEIERRGFEADNPPLPVPAATDGPQARRRFLIGVGAVVLAGGVGGGVLGLASYLNRDDGAAAPSTTDRSQPGRTPSRTATPTPTPTPTPPPTPTPTPTPKTRSLEFYVTGDTSLTSMTYTVNGKAETVRNVRLPWRKTVEVPALPRKSTWRAVYRFPPGEVRLRVLVDGFQVMNSVYAFAGEEGRGDDHGTV